MNSLLEGRFASYDIRVAPAPATASVQRDSGRRIQIQAAVMRIGVFGGSFDPPHNGHLLLAECCQSQAQLDRVRFTPAARQPLKPAGPHASDDQRIAMLELAIQDRPKFELSTIEIRRGGTSYTADTLAAMHRATPDDELFFLLGADALIDFHRWVRPAEICRLATLLIVQRAGAASPDLLIDRQAPGIAGVDLRIQNVEMPATPISSTEIRRQIAADEPAWRDAVPKSVARYIDRNRLYRRAS